MKRWLTFVLVLVAGSMTAKEVFAVGSDFSKEQIAAAGKHCVHGFWVNEQTVVFMEATRRNSTATFPSIWRDNTQRGRWSFTSGRRGRNRPGTRSRETPSPTGP